MIELKKENLSIVDCDIEFGIASFDCCGIEIELYRNTDDKWKILEVSYLDGGYIYINSSEVEHLLPDMIKAIEHE